MKHIRCLLVAMLVATPGCEESNQPQRATSGALPPVVGHVVGPQPGPDGRLAVTSNPFGSDPNARMEGRRLFVWFNCSGCHGEHAGGGMGPSLRDVMWIYGSGDEDIFNSIAEGRAFGMPAWGTKVPAEEIWKIVAYIQSLDTDLEAIPPPPNPVYPDPPPRRDVEDVQAGGS